MKKLSMVGCVVPKECLQEIGVLTLRPAVERYYVLRNLKIMSYAVR